MIIASEITPITPFLHVWQAYHPAVKADLFSTAIVTPRGVYFVDPIPVADSAFGKLLGTHSIAGIIVTNANHLRAAPEFAGRIAAPILSRGDSFPNEASAEFKTIAGDDRIDEELRAIAIDGAAPGEIAVYHEAKGGTLIIGDALINFEPQGLAFLPAKYCADQKEMRRSLRKLLNIEAERMLFAHGTPILTRATQRLTELLGGD